MALIHPMATEKTIKAIELENKITFVVDRNSTKPEIAKEIEKTFKVKVESINLMIRGNIKIASIKLKPETHAIDIATKLGIM